jgi:DNA-binding IclR family transcriptional regulator
VIVQRLSTARAMSIARLTEGTNLTRQAVTKHLAVLQEVGLARPSRRGREQVWELEPRRLEIARRFLDQVSRRWDEALERLRRLVEE